jgi:hypothetical protein
MRSSILLLVLVACGGSSPPPSASPRAEVDPPIDTPATPAAATPKESSPSSPPPKVVADSPPDPPASNPTEVKVGLESADKTIPAKVGQTVVVSLPHPGTAVDMEWKVIKVDKTFGQPKQTVLEAGFGPSTYADIFTWTTTPGPLNPVGKHTVEMHYRDKKDSSKPPQKKLTFTIDVN